MPLSKRTNPGVYKLPIKTEIKKSLGGFTIVGRRDTGVMVESASTWNEAEAKAKIMRGSNESKD